MDKQIIINGVDVSGCSYGEIEKDIFKCSCEYNVRSTSMFCKDNPNCYYKQLKCKEQEYEELKAEIKHYKQIAQYHGNLSVKYTNKSAKYKQTLAEIKEIAGNMNNECFYSDFDCKYCDMKNGCTYHKKIKILQKISECEVNNDS